MRRTSFCSLVLLVFFSFSCNRHSSDYSDFFCEPESNKIDVRIDSLNLERISPEVSGISYLGYSGIQGGRLFFADRLFGNLYQFDKNGIIEGVKIRKGNGPHEVPMNRIEAYCVSDNGHHYFLDGSTNLYEFDNNFDCVNKVLYYWSKKITDGEVYERTDSYCTSWGNVNLAVNHGVMYTNVAGESDDFNFMLPEYYRLTRIIEPRDVKTGAPYPLLGRLSPSVGYMNAFQGVFFRISDNGDFVVAFEADDLMYVYDKSFRVKYYFGQKGKDMNQDYLRLSVDSFQKELSEEQNTKGRYTSLCIVGDMTFRTYRTGIPQNQTRLQIYEGTTLIGDIQVPEGFKTLGYIEPYYYSEFICDEEKESMELYRFKL
ncbi:MAG: hypothetical protein J6N54_02920 [Bacteroidales bacterium]|nr:hypothetical protein [Bacteroidales bacterium]